MAQTRPTPSKDMRDAFEPGPGQFGRVSHMRLHSESGSLKPTPPFDLAKSLDFLTMFLPMRDGHTLEESSLTRGVSVEGRTVLFELRAAGTMKQPRVNYTLFSEGSLSPSTREALVDPYRLLSKPRR